MSLVPVLILCFVGISVVPGLGWYPVWDDIPDQANIRKLKKSKSKQK